MRFSEHDLVGQSMKPSWSEPLQIQLDNRVTGLAILALLVLLLSNALSGQTASTGALAGSVFDPSGAVIPGAEAHLVSPQTGEIVSTTSDGAGDFHFLLLTPGTYELQVSKTGFTSLHLVGIKIPVTETVRAELHLRVASVGGSVEDSSEALTVKTDTIALGRVVNQTAVTGLPLVTRNFAQIADLSPGGVMGVSNAGDLGAGGTALSQIDKSNDGLFVHGARSYDNNFQLDGVSVDVQGAPSERWYRCPIDAIQEFKVQTDFTMHHGRWGR